VKQFDYAARTRLMAGPGRRAELAAAVRGWGVSAVLLVADPGLGELGAGLLQQLRDAGLEASMHDQVPQNPDSAAAAQCAEVLNNTAAEAVVALGGGSTMDLAKAANILATNGGEMSDYLGYGKARHPLLPMAAIPTTTGTGSEAQSYCVIADATSRRKMACGDPGAAFRLTVLDPEPALGQPFGVRAASGWDAISHTVETWVTSGRNPMSLMCAREAWRLLDANYERVLTSPGDIDAIAAMQWAAYLAGWAIEHSMLGAAHACANPLTQRYGTTHGQALAVLLPCVVQWNQQMCHREYEELHHDLPARLAGLRSAAGLPRRLRDLGVREQDLPALCEAAAAQWTGTFNPRPFGAGGAMEIYQCAW
jgi:alcohol dehydrogenase